MELKLGVLADYACPGENGKLIIVGIFDNVTERLGKRPVALPPLYLVLRIDAHVTAGTAHKVQINLIDAAGSSVAPAFENAADFAPQGVGLLPLLGSISQISALSVSCAHLAGSAATRFSSSCRTAATCADIPLDCSSLRGCHGPAGQNALLRMLGDQKTHIPTRPHLF